MSCCILCINSALQRVLSKLIRRFLSERSFHNQDLVFGRLADGFCPLYFLRLHELALCLMCKDLEDLKLVAQWDGISGNSRRQVLLSLQVCASQLPHQLGSLRNWLGTN